jgi:transcriptional regulator with XRE-family HTH domain
MTELPWDNEHSFNEWRATLLQTFGDRLRQLRQQQGISQEELAFRCGLHRTYVSSVERGERNVSLVNIHRLALSLQVEPQALFLPLIETNE